MGRITFGGEMLNDFIFFPWLKPRAIEREDAKLVIILLDPIVKATGN